MSNYNINPETLGVGVDDDLRLVQVSFTPLFKELNGGNTVYSMLVKNLGERPLEHGVITVTFMSRGGTTASQVVKPNSQRFNLEKQ